VAGPDPSLLPQPANTISKPLGRETLTPDEVDLFEINEAFYGAVTDAALETMRQQGSPGPEVMAHGIGGFTRSAAEPAAVRQ
jgi:acetyl-CoA C-acetyltransferase